MHDRRFFTGGYATEGSICLWEFQESEGRLKKLEAVSGFKNPSYLILSNDRMNLYAVSELEDRGEVLAFALDNGAIPRFINRLPIKGKAACHLAVKDRLLVTANYLRGSLSVLSLDKNGGLNEVISEPDHKQPGREDVQAHAHYVMFLDESDRLLAADLGLDKVFVYRVDHQKQSLTEVEDEGISFPQGSGPRHLVRHPGRSDLLYVVCELSSQVYTVRIGENPQILQCLSTLPENCDAQNSTAAIKMSRDGRFLYASNRGYDGIAVFRVGDAGTLQVAGIVKTRGICPRDFDLFDSFAVVAYQDSGALEVFEIDADTGLLKETGITAEAAAPVCVCPLR